MIFYGLRLWKCMMIIARSNLKMREGIPSTIVGNILKYHAQQRQAVFRLYLARLIRQSEPEGLASVV